MSVETQAAQPDIQVEKKKSTGSTFTRVFRYSVVRLSILFVTVVISIFLTIMIANMGGYVDQIMAGEIRERIGVQMSTDPNFRDMPIETKQETFAKLVEQEEKRLGLDQPLVIRSVRYLTNALTLRLGRAILMTSDKGSKLVSEIILDRLPPTLLLMGSSNLILFFGSLLIALALSRSYGSFWDKVIIALSPTSAAPSWFYGIFLILIFGAFLRVLPFGGMIDPVIPDTKIGYWLSVLKHLILPASALIIASLFVSIYNYRTFFLIYSSEDYVEMAKAKGLQDRDIERRYILRPTLPTIITNFSLLIIGLWTGAIITETVFSWPGLGKATYQAIGLFDVPVIVGVTIIFAYLLAITVFLLDFIYALVDPRVKIGEGSSVS